MHPQPQLFNGAFETGLRSLIVLAETVPDRCDLERLVYFDYLVIHSADANGPESLHPNTPLRNGEIIIRRSSIERGVHLMMSRNLIERHHDRHGIGYSATETARPFLDGLSSDYSRDLVHRAEWVITQFGGLSTGELRSYFNEHFEGWTREFQSSLPSHDELT